MLQNNCHCPQSIPLITDFKHDSTDKSKMKAAIQGVPDLTNPQKPSILTNPFGSARMLNNWGVQSMNCSSFE